MNTRREALMFFLELYPSIFPNYGLDISPHVTSERPDPTEWALEQVEKVANAWGFDEDKQPGEEPEVNIHPMPTPCPYPTAPPYPPAPPIIQPQEPWTHQPGPFPPQITWGTLNQ